MKRLLFFLLMLGAFFCFIKPAHAGTYQLFASPTTTLTTFDYWTNPVVNHDTQNFIATTTGLMEWFEIIGCNANGFGNCTGLPTYMSFRRNDQVVSGTWSVGPEGGNYAKYTLLEPTSTYPGDNWTLYFGNYDWNGTEKLKLSVTSPSTTYLNAYNYDTFEKNSGTANFDAWIKYSLSPVSEYFYFTEPANKSVFAYDDLQNYAFTCLSTTSYWAFYYDDDYLQAQESDFASCASSTGIYFENDMINLVNNTDGKVRGIFKVKEGFRTLTVLDKRWLTTPTDNYKITVEYYGSLKYSQKMFGIVWYPENDGTSQIYITDTSTASFPFLIGIQKGTGGTVEPNASTSLFTVWTQQSDQDWTDTTYPVDGPLSNWTAVQYVNGPELGWNYEKKSWDFVLNASSSVGYYQHYLITYQNPYSGDQSEYKILYFIVRPYNDITDETTDKNYAKTFNTTSSCAYDPDCADTGNDCANFCGGAEPSFLGAYICRPVCYLVYPEKLANGGLNSNAYELITTITDYPPFGYLFAYSDLVFDSASSTTSTDPGWKDLENATLLIYLRQLMGWCLYLLFGLWVFKFFMKKI